MRRPCRTVGPFNPKLCQKPALFVLIFQITAWGVAPRVLADTGTPGDTPTEFRIPAMPVPAALGELARQARVQLFFISDEFEDVQANPVFGTYSTQQALNLLLDGTGLVATYTPESGVELRPATQPIETAAPVPEPGVSDTDIPPRPDTVEEIVVTGSRIRGAGAVYPVVTITRQEIEQSGFASVEALVQSLPQNFGAGVSQDSFTDLRGAANAVGANVGQIAGGASVNLHGLGADSTLVLLNGRRIAASGLNAQFFDISAIPLTAVERVEVLTDGASAIYGADAIAGVVNFILRDDYEGAETRLSYGEDGKGDTSELLFGQVFGKNWGSGKLVVAYEYYRHDNLANLDRSFAASSDLRPLGGSDWRSIGGNPANISAGDQLFAIPAGQDGTSLTPADFPVDANGVPTTPPNRHDIRAGEDFLPEQERHGLVLNLSQHVSTAAELFAEVRFSNRKNVARFDQAQLDIEVPSNNPYFVDPTGTGLASVTVEDYAFGTDLGSIVNNGETDSYGGVIGLRFKLGGNWQGVAVGTYSKEKTEAVLSNQVNQVAVAAAANNTTVETALNPFGDGSHTNAAVLDSLRTGGNADKAENELWTLGLNLNADALRLPGGMVRLASGVQYRRESLLAQSIVGSEFEAPVMQPRTDGSRDVISAYAELFVPLIGTGNSRPGAHQLALTFAARSEDYSDFGTSTNPQLGISWSPAPDLTLRGSWGTSFKAPGLSQLDVSDLTTNTIVYFPQSFVDSGDFPFPTIILAGGNEDLEAEEATTWTVGFDWTPNRGLSLHASYFDIMFDNRIERPFVTTAQAFEPRFAAFLNTNPTSQQIADLVNDRRWNERFGVPAADLLSGAAPVGAIGDGRINNISSSVVSGIDLWLSQALETELGSFEFGLNVNYLFDFKRALVDADPLTEEVDTLGRPVDFRARGSISWRSGAWEASGFLNYTDRYTDNVSDPARPIDAWTTMDLSLSFDSGLQGGILGNTVFLLGVQNLFDEDPPFADTIGGLGYDSTNADGRGRFVTLRVKTEW